MPLPDNGRRRVVIEDVQPSVDDGRFPIKRTPDEVVEVKADVFTDGHDLVSAVLRYRRVDDDEDWQEVWMEPLVNDRYCARFVVEEIGAYEFEVEGWVDHFASWRHGLERWLKARQDVSSELLEGAAMIRAAAARATEKERRRLHSTADALAVTDQPAEFRAEHVTKDIARLMRRLTDRGNSTRSGIRRVRVDRERARFSAWYEMFPRSTGPDPTRSGTFREAASRIPEIADMGFDVLYLPPIHPIGQTNRKGPGNTLVAQEGDPGSPWAIGGKEGGHTAIEPGLGSIEDFRWFREQAERHGMEIALDLAYQVSPDHPYATQHHEWFKQRPDGTLKYAENPPKRYQDIYPFHFDHDAWPPLWLELRDVVLFWLGHGVRIFRVDNPHTKPFRFWEWLIADVHAHDPHVIFLAEAFTRPKVMRHLAKLGFTQSYTYFTWRNTKAELEEYFTELTQTTMQEYFRPNLFANTPDILHEFLQEGGLAGLPHPLDPRRHAWRQLWDLQQLRDRRKPAGGPRLGRVSPFGKIRAASVGLRQPAEHQGLDSTGQHHPAHVSRSSVQCRPSVSSDDDRRPHRLQQAGPQWDVADPDSRVAQPAAATRGMGLSGPSGLPGRRQRAVHRARRAHRARVHVARPVELWYRLDPDLPAHVLFVPRPVLADATAARIL